MAVTTNLIEDNKMNERVSTVVNDIVDGVRAALIKNNVSFDEYRAGFMHLIGTAENHEIPLLVDMFFNQTICDIEMKNRKGTRSSVEGPYFMEGAPWVDEKANVCGDNVEPLLVRGVVTDTNNQPIPGVELDLWWANPEGKYSGYTDELPKEYFRCKVKTDDEGKYSVMASMPMEYPITTERHVHTGKLLEMLGRQGMRTKHLHQKYRKDGYCTLTTQAYFEGASYLDADPVEAVVDELVYRLSDENGVAVLQLETQLDAV